MSTLRGDLGQKLATKVQDEGIKALSESIWRNLLRKTLIGKVIEQILGAELVEKLVMAPRVGYWPSIKNPRSFNEKIVHRKLYTNDNRFVTIADKYTVRSYVRDRVGEEVLNEVYHVTDTPSDIPFSELPSEFVIKTGNKGVIIIENKNKVDQEKIIKKCQKRIDKSYGVDKYEYWYEEADQKAIVEKKLEGRRQNTPIDYKFYCFHGNVEYIQANIDRFGNHVKSVYDKEWNYLDIKYNHPQGHRISRPELLDRMINIAEQLSEEFEFIRVDLYETKDNGVIFGELTPAPASGTGRFRPISQDFEWGKKW